VQLLKLHASYYTLLLLLVLRCAVLCCAVKTLE
jgi:hypothetical protein